jgi:hypothetical protein
MKKQGDCKGTDPLDVLLVVQGKPFLPSPLDHLLVFLLVDAGKESKFHQLVFGKNVVPFDFTVLVFSIANILSLYKTLAPLSRGKRLMCLDPPLVA